MLAGMKDIYASARYTLEQRYFAKGDRGLTALSGIRIVQLTDMHLFASTEGQLLGMNTDHSFNEVLKLVRSRVPAMDLILATGDLSQDGSETSYQRLKSYLGAFDVPYYWLSGNHDQNSMLNRMSQSTSASEPIIDVGEWRIVMLDSSVAEQVHGFLDDDQLQVLKQALVTDKHVLICCHHHPIPMGSQWIDNIGIRNSADFMDIIESSPNVKAVLWGHVHQEVDEVITERRFMATPSTCIQFTKYSADFAVDTLSPGFRYLELMPDGRVVTEVHRVTGVEFTIDYSIKGY